MALTSIFSVELPGIEPVSVCWSPSRTDTELRNHIEGDSPELTSLDTECAQKCPTGPSTDNRNCARYSVD